MTTEEITNGIQVTMAEAEPLIQDLLNVNLVPQLHSSPGIGKSALAKKIARKNNLKLIDIRLSQADPADFNGFPFILHRESQNTKAGYVPMDQFPVEGDPLPVKTWKKEKAVTDGQEGFRMVPDTYYDGWLILFDEFNSAPLAVQAAAYKIILDKMVGMHHLHKRVRMICAGNLVTDKAIVMRQSTAMQSRIIHLVIQVCNDAWRKWADEEKIDHRVKSFISFKPDLLHAFDPNHNDLTFPCPRTWQFVSKIITPMKEVEMVKLPLFTGSVGDGAGREFFSYTQIYKDIPTIPQIIEDPENVFFGNDPSMQHALSGLIGFYMDANNVGQLSKFIQRLEIDFQALTFRAVLRREKIEKIRGDKSIRKSAGLVAWLANNAEEIV